MYTRNKAIQDATSQQVVGATSNITIQFGCALNANTIDCRWFPFLRFGLFYDQAVTLNIRGSLDNVTFFTYESLAIAANTYTTAYDLPAPKGGDGFYVLQYPFLSIQIANAGAVATTIQQAYVAIQNFRS